MEKRSEYSASVAHKLESLPPVRTGNSNIEEEWLKIAEAVCSSAEGLVGYFGRRNKDWFEDNCTELKQLLDEKHNAHAAYVPNPSSRFLKGKWQEARTRVQRTLRETENQWWLNKAKEIQRFADANDQQNFYSALKQIYGPRNRTLAPVRTVDGAS